MMKQRAQNIWPPRTHNILSTTLQSKTSAVGFSCPGMTSGIVTLLLRRHQRLAKDLPSEPNSPSMPAGTHIDELLLHTSIACSALGIAGVKIPCDDPQPDVIDLALLGDTQLIPNSGKGNTAVPCFQGTNVSLIERAHPEPTMIAFKHTGTP